MAEQEVTTIEEQKFVGYTIEGAEKLVGATVLTKSVDGWSSRELQTPEAFQKIQQNAQNAINNLDILLKIVKQGADVAKLFLLLANPAGAIIKLAANEIISLCNDFKEIGVFYLFINPNDEAYGGKTSKEYGLTIKQDENGLYQFEPPRPRGVAVGVAYQKTLNIADLATNYRDRNGKKQGTPEFIPPMPVFDNPPKWELGGYDPATWTGHAPVTSIPLANGIFPPEMKPSRVLQLMSESFDDAGDVSIFEINSSDKNAVLVAKKAGKPIFTATDQKIDMNNFDPDRLQTEDLFLLPEESLDIDGVPVKLGLTERKQITSRVNSGKPNFAGSSNIQGVEVIAIVALVGVESYQEFVDAFKSLNGLFGGMPSLSDFTKDISTILDDALNPAPIPMSIMNDTAWGEFTVGDFIVGQTSGATAKITKIVTSKKYQQKKIKTTIVPIAATTHTELNIEIDVENRDIQFLEDVYNKPTSAVFSTLVDDNTNGNLIQKDILVEMKSGNITFRPDETIFEGIETPIVPASAIQPLEVPSKILPKTPKGSALVPWIKYNDVAPDDVASYGRVLGVDTNAPDSIHPDWSSIKIKDVIPIYGRFFDEIIQFAEGLKGYAAGADAFIARIIKLIDDTIKEFEETVNTIKAFLQLFVDGLPGAGVYWLAIKTFGGNAAIQAALTGSTNQPPDNLNFCAGFIMVSVSGVGGSSSTAGIEQLFGKAGMGLKFIEVAPIPEVSELDTAILAAQDQYNAAKAAQVELAANVFDIIDQVKFRDATTIKFKDWNGKAPNVGDYVLGMKSGAFGQILAFSVEERELILDHINIGPTVVATTVAVESVIIQEDITNTESGGNAVAVEFPYDGSIPTSGSTTPAFGKDGEFPLVTDARFTATSAVSNRSSHKPNGIGTTVYEIFQGNVGTFESEGTSYVTEFELEYQLPAGHFMRKTVRGERKMKQRVSTIIDGSVKEPVLASGYNGMYGYFTGDDIIISFDEEAAQTFFADVEGRNTKDDKITRLKSPPHTDLTTTYQMSVVVNGNDSFTLSRGDKGGIVESFAEALNNTLNPENQPEE